MGSKSPATTTQETTTKLSPQQQQIMDTALPYAQQYASTPIQQYQGSGIAPLNATEQAAGSQALAAAQTGGDLASAAASSQKMLLDPNFMLNPQSNPFLQQAAQDSADMTRRQLTESELPSLRTGATMAGGAYSGGSTKAGIAEGLATGRTNDAISRNATSMMFDAYKTGLQGMQGAVMGNDKVQAQQLFQPEVTSAVGGQQRAVEQAQLDEAIKRFYTGQSLPFIQAQELMSLLQGMPGATASSTATGSVPKGNMVMGGLGGAASGAAIGSVVPGIGTGIGAGVGGLAGLLANR